MASDADELVKRLKNQDHTALAELFEINRDRLSRMVSIRMDRRLKGRIDATDVLQEAYMILSQKIGNFADYPDMSPYVWMRLTVNDRLIALHRKHIQAGKRDARKEISMSQKANPDESSAEIVDTLADTVSSVGGKVARAEVTKMIKATLECMEAKDREIILMRIFEGMSNAEAAQALDLTANGASSRFSRAMDRLQKDVLKTESGEEDE
ncbi:MAG: sigma-70 family RNA polymerase sigma factor [Planctomycetaceae bacterium]|nr:sigma-70 family RNA polymerase sigma factor [Planctomycetaceae bacterium]MCP4463642.1 sigma-70 family RNA polymerase sigma factor [Planctomycetaceae bacterium]